MVVRGFGLGHHVGALARRLKQHGAVIVFEPDVGLLRAVLERIDCAAWLKACDVAIVTDPEDTGAIAAAVSGIEAVLAAGTVLVDHPPSKARLGASSDRFGEQFTTVMKAVRTNVVTTLVQVDITVKNLLMNMAWYATAPGVLDLANACKGRPAIVVSAGPSLRRNIDLLSRPGVRDCVVIIAVQTVLKTLLAKGIKPHYVTALDYHEISRRFYEGLTKEDVEGVTLVAEPQCNRAILEAFPGQVRCTADHVLDQVLGQKLARRMGEITPGATVAHLAYYLARHLGCDPVILIGQDLGFTDGQYYAPGAAIHQVWSSELNEFRTLEMLEWERIARMRSLLRKVPDQAGRTIYTDEQMSTYLVQFERDFMHDAARGLTTIDATEGGVLKQHTKVMRLAEALEVHAGTSGAAAFALPKAPATLGEDRLRAVEARLRDLRQSTTHITRLARDAAAVLGEMLERQRDIDRVNRLITKVDALGKEAVAQSAYWLVQYIIQTGQFNRFRADRAIHIDPSLSTMEKQKKEIERDIVNVNWLADAAAHVGELLDEAIDALIMPSARETKNEQAQRAASSMVSARDGTARRNVWAVLMVDPVTSGLGTPRDLGRPFLLGLNPLQMTLARLAQCRKLDGVLLLCADPVQVRKLIGTPPKGLRVEVEPIDAGTAHERARAVGAARLWSRHCWRGGIANLSCFDECISPVVAAPAMESRGIDAAVVVGADWPLVDPRLVDEVIARHLDRPDVNQLTFTQAPPGLGACVITRHMLAELASANSPLATIGGLLGYIPLAPQGDPIAKPACVSAEPHIRDFLARCIPDSERRLAGLAAALAPLGTRSLSANASELAHAIAGAVDSSTCGHSFGVEMVVIEAADSVVSASALASLGEDVALTILDDPTNWRAAAELAVHARQSGFAGIHIKTSLSGGIDQAKAFLEASPDALSVLMDSADEQTPSPALDCLLETCTKSHGLPSPWIIPRLTRCDATYDRIEEFYNRWMLTAGACVIDPLPAPIPGDRIEPLPVPTSVRTRAKHSTIVIRRDGTVTDGAGSLLGSLSADNLAALVESKGFGTQNRRHQPADKHGIMSTSVLAIILARAPAAKAALERTPRRSPAARASRGPSRRPSRPSL